MAGSGHRRTVRAGTVDEAAGCGTGALSVDHRQVADRLATLYAGLEISTFQLPPEIQEGGTKDKAPNLQERISRLERDAVAEALRVAHGKKIRAAALLGISRPTLDKKIEDFGLVVEKDRRA